MSGSARVRAVWPPTRPKKTVALAARHAPGRSRQVLAEWNDTALAVPSVPAGASRLRLPHAGRVAVVFDGTEAVSGTERRPTGWRRKLVAGGAGPERS